MNFPPQNIGGNIRVLWGDASQNAAAPVLIIAGGTGDNVKTTGKTVDRQNAAGGMAQSCVHAIGYMMTLADTKTISFAVEIQDSDDDSTWNTAVAIQAATVAATGATPTTQYNGVVENSVDLSGYRRYVRFNVTPNLSNTSTDTGHYTSLVVLGGAPMGAI